MNCGSGATLKVKHKDFYANLSKASKQTKVMSCPKMVYLTALPIPYTIAEINDIPHNLSWATIMDNHDMSCPFFP